MSIAEKHYRGWLWPAVLAFCAGFAARNPAPHKPHVLPPSRMDSCLSVLDTSRTSPTDAGWIHWFTARDLSGGLNLKMTSVEKGAAYHAAHKHADPEIIFVLEGDARLTLEGEERIVPAMTSLYCPPGLLHGISRASDRPLRYLIIRTQ